MSSMPRPDLLNVPEFRDWSIAAVRLLQGIVYVDDRREWDIVLRARQHLDGFFARIGLTLVVDETEGYAYVRQWTEEECPEGYEQVPRLVRRVPLGYGPTLLAVLLRDELRRHEEEQVQNERCVVETDAILDQWRAFFPPAHDEVKQRKELGAALNKLCELGFVRRFADDPEQWEVRRILKARLPAAELENLRAQLMEAVARQAGSSARPAEGGDGDA